MKARLQTIVDRGFKAPPAGASADVLAEIERAFRLKELGALTDEEFSREKERLLRRP